MCAARDQRRGVPSQGRGLRRAPSSCLRLHETGPLVHSPLEWKPDLKAAGPASWAPFRHLRAIRGLLSAGPLTPGFTLRKANLSCDHWSVTSAKRALGLAGLLGVIMMRRVAWSLVLQPKSLGNPTAMSSQATFFFPRQISGAAQVLTPFGCEHQ